MMKCILAGGVGSRSFVTCLSTSFHLIAIIGAAFVANARLVRDQSSRHQSLRCLGPIVKRKD